MAKYTEEDFAVSCDNCNLKFGNHHMEDWCPADGGGGGYSKTSKFYSSVATHLNEGGIPNPADEAGDHDYDESDEDESESHPDTDPHYAEYSLQAECTNCGHIRGNHMAEAPHGLDDCEAFRGDGEYAHKPKPSMLQNFNWTPISQELFDSPMPDKLSKLANWLATQGAAGISSKWNELIMPLVNREAKQDKTLLSAVKPGDWAIGLVKQSHHSNNVLVCGKIVADPVFQHLPAIRIGHAGLAYEIDGIWLDGWGKEELPFKGWSAHVVCAMILTNEMLNKQERLLKDNVPYAVGKEIFG